MPLLLTFDTRNHLLESDDIEHEWQRSIREQRRSNRRRITVGLVNEFGTVDFETKFNDYRVLGVAPMSVAALHNLFMTQIRSAFVAGAYYPALVGAGALGERMLNQLIVVLRNDYPDHPATNAVIANRESFSNWRKCIEALAGWGVLSDPLVADFTRLERLRHRAVHYDPALDTSDAREAAIEAVRLLQDIIQDLFPPLGGPPRFIAGTTGHSYLSSGAEKEPFIRHFYLPASVLVSPRFEMRPVQRQDGSAWFDVYDDDQYQMRYSTLTDAEFAAHCNDIRRFWPESLDEQRN